MTKPSDFKKFIGTPFQPYILPIIPAGGTLAEDSSLTPDHLGKIPGWWSTTDHAWRGYQYWQRLETKKKYLENWQGWQDPITPKNPHTAGVPIAVGLRLGELIAIDIDINEPELADFAEIIVRMVLGAQLCVRRREGSARRVLIYLHN
jgi:hypothetical protein